MSEDTEECAKTAVTPHASLDSAGRRLWISYDSADSGYMSHTPSGFENSGYRTRLISRRGFRNRPEPYRFKFNLLNNSESCESSIDDIVERNAMRNNRSSSVELDESSVEPIRSYGMELRSYSRRSFKPACKLVDMLSSSPLPALQLSPFSIKERTDVKLVPPQSTPHLSSRIQSPLHNASFSPISSKSNTLTGSVNSKKLSNLMITERPMLIQKRPKRLDFDQRFPMERSRAMYDCTGKETVDVLRLLGERNSYPRIVSKIFSYLSPQDLCAVSMVSKSWRRICSNDSKAESRRLNYVTQRQQAKENLKNVWKCKLDEDIAMGSPRTRVSKRGLLTAVHTNLLQVPHHLPPNSPPVSPSKVKFHSFVKASRTLAPWEHLLPCPRCNFACHVDHKTSVGTCSRQGCSMEEFCILCSLKPHKGSCTMPLLATPTKRNRPQPIVGTKQCKRNLRRLSRLT